MYIRHSQNGNPIEYVALQCNPRQWHNCIVMQKQHFCYIIGHKPDRDIIIVVIKASYML